MGRTAGKQDAPVWSLIPRPLHLPNAESLRQRHAVGPGKVVRAKMPHIPHSPSSTYTLSPI
jgi:hypothetical protein